MSDETELDEKYDWDSEERLYLQCRRCKRQYLVEMVINPYNRLTYEYDPKFCPCCGAKVKRVHQGEGHCYT